VAKPFATLSRKFATWPKAKGLAKRAAANQQDSTEIRRWNVFIDMFANPELKNSSWEFSLFCVQSETIPVFLP
jgi:hypothetical protein